MNLVNLLRDQTHIVLGQAQPVEGAQAAMNTQTVPMNSTGVVYQTQGFVSNPHQQTASTTSIAYWRSVGLLMSSASTDPTPFRVKGYVTLTNQRSFLIVGYAPASPSGTNDSISKVVGLPLSTHDSIESAKIDDILMLPGVKEGDADFGKPLAFGIAIAGATQGRLSFALSVQNLSKTAPQFAASMS